LGYSGDEIPYIIKKSMAITAALETTKFNFSVSGKYVDAFRTLAGTGTILQKIKSHLILLLTCQPDITSQNTSA
jgi:Fe(3+) dicitrate transport protein